MAALWPVAEDFSEYPPAEARGKPTGSTMALLPTLVFRSKNGRLLRFGAPLSSPTRPPIWPTSSNCQAVIAGFLSSLTRSTNCCEKWSHQPAGNQDDRLDQYASRIGLPAMMSMANGAGTAM